MRCFINFARTTDLIRGKNYETSINLTKFGFGYYYYKNISQFPLLVNILFKNLEGVRIEKSFHLSEVSFKLDSGEEKIILAKLNPHGKIKQEVSERVSPIKKKRK
jgi:hypothetical protein